jgi:hypothetical protein
MYIYNSHQEELSNDDILKCFDEFNLNRFIKKVKIFQYDPNTVKSLTIDVRTIRDYVSSNYNENDRILFLKSDIVLSKRYFENISELPPDKEVNFTSPFIGAKKRLSNDEIIEYSLRDKYIPSDDITFFIEDKYQSENNDFNNRPHVKPTDEQIKFTSCYCIRDWSCHFMTVSLMKYMNLNPVATWGGVCLQKLLPYLIETDTAFTIHKYHNIKSDNRETDREGPVESWFMS